MGKGFCAVAGKVRNTVACRAVIVGLAVLPAGGAAAQSGMLVQAASGYGGSYGSGYAPVSAGGSGGYGGGFIEMLMTGEPALAAGSRRAGASRSGYPVEAYDRSVDRGYDHSYQRGYAPDPRGGDPFAQERAYGRPGYGRAQVAALPAGDPAAMRIPRALDPRYQRQTVSYDGPEKPGTIVVDTPSKFLYLVQPGGQALRYGIGVGRPGFAWSGMKAITAKREWPDWTPPPEMIKRRPDLPAHMAGGPENPLGARAMYLGSSLYRIHGTNEPTTIGQSVSSGCIRMMNEDVVDLYERVGVGTKVLVI